MSLVTCFQDYGGGGEEKKTLQKLANTEPVTSDTNGDAMQTACSCHMDVRKKTSLSSFPKPLPPGPQLMSSNTDSERGPTDFLEELSHWEWALKVQKPVPSPVVSLSSTLGSGCELAAAAPAPYLPACHLDCHGLSTTPACLLPAAHPDGHGLIL